MATRNRRKVGNGSETSIAGRSLNRKDLVLLGDHEPVPWIAAFRPTPPAAVESVRLRRLREFESAKDAPESVEPAPQKERQWSDRDYVLVFDPRGVEPLELYAERSAPKPNPTTARRAVSQETAYQGPSWCQQQRGPSCSGMPSNGSITYRYQPSGFGPIPHPSNDTQSRST